MEIFLILIFFIQTYLLPVKAWQKGHKNYSRNKIDVFLTFFFSLFLNFSPFSWILDAFLPIIQEKKKKEYLPNPWSPAQFQVGRAVQPDMRGWTALHT